MGVQDANIAGNVHGGWIMKLCDDVAAIAATRLAGGRVVTAAVDEMRFRSPIHVGDVVTLRATVNAAWRTSMEVGVRVEAEDVRTGAISHTCTAYMTMVSLGQDEKPLPLPPLAPRTPEDERRHREANLRREVRLAKPGELRRARRPSRRGAPDGAAGSPRPAGGPAAPRAARIDAGRDR